MVSATTVAVVAAAAAAAVVVSDVADVDVAAAYNAAYNTAAGTTATIANTATITANNSYVAAGPDGTLLWNRDNIISIERYGDT